MDMLPIMLVGLGGLGFVALVALALSGPSPARAQSRRLSAVRERHGTAQAQSEERMRRITTTRATRMDLAFGKVLPNRANLQKRLAMTGKSWTVGQYGLMSAGPPLPPQTHTPKVPQPPHSAPDKPPHPRQLPRPDLPPPYPPTPPQPLTNPPTPRTPTHNTPPRPTRARRPTTTHHPPGPT
jgi:hypothetical protein